MSQTLSELTYEKDYHQWTIEQAQALRELVNTHQEQNTKLTSPSNPPID